MSTQLYFTSSGSFSGKTILFLHGGGAAGWMWEPAIDRLQDFHCLAPDLPEHGKSMDVKPFSMRLAAEQAIELIRQEAHGGKAVVVGLSEGAQTVVEMLSIAPEVIERAFISSALLLPMRGYGWASSPAILKWMFRVSVPPFRNSDWWMRLNMKYSAAIPESFFARYKENFQRMTEDQFVHLMAANQTYRLPDNLAKAGAPTLVVTGKREYPAMKESAKALAAALPHAQVAEVDLGKGASLAGEHNWAMTAPELFAATVRNMMIGETIPDMITLDNVERE